MLKPITPSLWFDGKAEEAANYYCSVFPNSRILTIAHYTEAGPGPAGSVLTVDYELDGQRFININGGPQFTFDEAISFTITCKDQAELDDYWAKLTEGGSESVCGWCKDRYGVSWQVVPDGMDEMFSHPDKTRAERATKAMFGMRKIDIAALYAAADAAE